jgi:preprotein translocase subunit SecE
MSPMATINKSSKDTPGKKNRQPEASQSPIESISIYLKGVRSEWSKISWPTWRQIWGQTIVVLVMVSMITLILFIMDYSFHFIISSIIPHRS